MKFGILEISDHEQYLYSMIKILGQIDSELNLYVNEKMSNHMKKLLGEEYLKYNWNIKQENQSVFNYLKFVKKDSYEKKIDYIYIGTLQKNYFEYVLYLSFNKTKNIISIHNINSWFEKNYKKTIKNIIKKKLKKICLNCSSGINLYGENMKKYLLEKFNYKKKITQIPFSIFELDKVENKIISENKIKFVIPGGIDLERRNYEIILKVMAELSEKYNNISLILLGKVKSETEKELIKKYENLKYNLEYFEEYISEDFFEKKMFESDVIIAPTVFEFEFEGNLEYYGTTKESGATFAFAKYSKPGIIPEYIKIYKGQETSIIQYKNKFDLLEKIEFILKNEKVLEEMKKEAFKNSNIFSLEESLKKFKIDIECK